MLILVELSNETVLLQITMEAGCLVRPKCCVIITTVQVKVDGVIGQNGAVIRCIMVKQSKNIDTG